MGNVMSRGVPASPVHLSCQEGYSTTVSGCASFRVISQMTDISPSSKESRGMYVPGQD